MGERRDDLARGNDLAAIFADLIAGIAGLGAGGCFGIFQLDLVVAHIDLTADGDDLAAVFADPVAGVAGGGAGGLFGVFQLRHVVQHRDLAAPDNDLAAVFADLIAGVAGGGAGGRAGVFLLRLMGARRDLFAHGAYLSADAANLIARVTGCGAGGLRGVLKHAAVSLRRDLNRRADRVHPRRVGEKHAAFLASPVGLAAGVDAGRLHAGNPLELMHVRVGIARDAEIARLVHAQQNRRGVFAQRHRDLAGLKRIVQPCFDGEGAHRVGEDVFRRRDLDHNAALRQEERFVSVRALLQEVRVEEVQRVSGGLAAQSGLILIGLRAVFRSHKVQICPERVRADRGLQPAFAHIDDVAAQLTVSAGARPFVISGMCRRRIKMRRLNVVFAVGDAIVQERPVSLHAGGFVARGDPLLLRSGIEHMPQTAAVAEHIVLELRRRAPELHLLQLSAGAEGVLLHGGNAGRNRHGLQPGAAEERLEPNDGNALGDRQALQPFADRKRIGRQGFQPFGDRDALQAYAGQKRADAEALQRRRQIDALHALAVGKRPRADRGHALRDDHARQISAAVKRRSADRLDRITPDGRRNDQIAPRGIAAGDRHGAVGDRVFQIVCICRQRAERQQRQQHHQRQQQADPSFSHTNASIRKNLKGKIHTVSEL